ncbi:MAG: lactonase family protein [Terriglobales bacterium]
MGTRFRFLPGLAAQFFPVRVSLVLALLLPVLLLGLNACTSSNSTTTSGTGALFVATQGDSLVSAFSIDLTTGALTANGTGVATGTVPSAMIAAPSGTTLFVANSNPSVPANSPACTLPSPGTITAYTVKSDGTVTAVSGSTTAGSIPLSMAIDSGGHFLFVANQGLQCNSASGTISVFSIKDTTLTEVAGSPFTAAAPLAPTDPGPSGIAVTPDGKFVYVANEFDGTVTGFSVDTTSGTLTRGATLLAGTAPAGVGMTPDGGFLYVANSGSSNVSAFSICNQVVTNCNDPNNPDGSLNVIAGSPFPAGLGPAFAIPAPSGKFLFVVNRLSNQISQYKIASGTGVLSANTQATISSGLNPVWATARAGTTVVTATSGTTDFLFVANFGASTISVYGYDSTVGILGLLGAPVTSGGQPAAVAAE